LLRLGTARPSAVGKIYSGRGQSQARAHRDRSRRRPV